MKKKVYSKKAHQKRRETIFVGVLIGLLILAVVMGIVDWLNGDEGTGFTVTEDGHVHAADGTHIGTVEEIFGEGVVVTEDGHVHGADGEHVGSLDDIVISDGHDHTEDDGHDHDEEAESGEAAE